MKLSKTTIQELEEILKNEYGATLSKSELEKFAYSLVGYFHILLKAEIRGKNGEKFGNSSVSRIDSVIQKKENGND